MALPYELEVLEDLISENLHPKQLLLFAADAKQLAEWKELLAEEKKRFTKTVRKTVYSFEKLYSKAAYIQVQQAGITRMMDAVFQYLSLQLNAHGIADFYKELYEQLNELLYYLKDNFPKYFDEDAKLPDGIRQEKGKGFQEILDTICEFLKQIKAKPAFIELVCEPFEYFLSAENDISYRELEYLQELQDELLPFTNEPAENITEGIMERLLYLNFNSVLFFNYYIIELSEQASLKNTITERVDHFSWQMKIINQTIVKPNRIYLKHSSTIKELLASWIAEEMYYLDTKHQLSLPLTASTKTERQKKVHVQLTVADLALSAKLLLDTNVIINIKYTELIKLIAGGFRTNRQANISEQAIYNAGFGITTTGKEKMKMVLMNMVRKMGEY